MRDDGGVAAYQIEAIQQDDKEWREATGRAYFVNSSDVGL